MIVQVWSIPSSLVLVLIFVTSPSTTVIVIMQDELDSFPPEVEKRDFSSEISAFPSVRTYESPSFLASVTKSGLYAVWPRRFAIYSRAFSSVCLELVGLPAPTLVLSIPSA